MICVLKIQDGDIKGWIIAADIHDARHKARSAWQNDLAAALDEIESPQPGKTILPTGDIMLVG